MENNEAQIRSLRAQAVDSVTLEIMAHGIVLTRDQADDLGEPTLDWMAGRLGLDVRETDAGVECTPPRGDVADEIEIEPTDVEVRLDTPNGPLVEYGGHDVETVEAEIPEGYTVDWSSAIEISVTGAHTLRYRAPLVRDAA